MANNSSTTPSSDTDMTLMDESASAFSITVGLLGAVIMAALTGLMYGYYRTRRAEQTANSASVRDAVVHGYERKPRPHEFASMGRVLLLGFVYLVVGTNRLAWGPNHVNLLRVAMGLVVNLVWVDYVARRTLLAFDKIRDELVRPALWTLIAIGTATVGSSEGAREFAFAIVVLTCVAVLSVALVGCPRPGLYPLDRKLSVCCGLLAAAALLLLVGELISPAYTNVISSGGALLFMLVAHVLLIIVHALAGPADQVQMDASSDEMYRETPDRDLTEPSCLGSSTPAQQSTAFPAGFLSEEEGAL